MKNGGDAKRKRREGEKEKEEKLKRRRSQSKDYISGRPTEPVRSLYAYALRVKRGVGGAAPDTGRGRRRKEWGGKWGDEKEGDSKGFGGESRATKSFLEREVAMNECVFLPPSSLSL